MAAALVLPSPAPVRACFHGPCYCLWWSSQPTTTAKQRPSHTPPSPLHSETGRLLLAFLLGAACTAAGSLLAFALFPLAPLGDEAWRIAAALTARHIGAPLG